MTEEQSTTEKQPMLRIYQSIPKLMLANFLSGVAWGLGSVIGATVVVAVIGILIARSSQLPLLGKLVELTIAEIEQAQINTQFTSD